MKVTISGTRLNINLSLHLTLTIRLYSLYILILSSLLTTALILWCVCLMIKLQVCTVTIIFAGESGADESRVAATAAAEASTVYNQKQDWFEDQHSSSCSHCALPLNLYRAQAAPVVLPCQ